jgi:hypothetical protein
VEGDDPLMNTLDEVFEFFLDDSEDLDPAMELDILAGGDPTTNAAENPEAAGGGAGTQEPDTNPPQNVDADTPPDTEGDPGMGDDMGEEDEFGDEEGGDSMGDVDTNSGDPNNPDMERRINLRKLILALINAYEGSINAMINGTPPADDNLATKYYNLQDKMIKARNILYEIATNDIYAKPYEDSLRRYSALNQLYSICVEYLNTILIKKPEDVKKRKRGPSAFRNNVKVM